MDYAHLNLEHFFSKHNDLDMIKDKSDFVMIVMEKLKVRLIWIVIIIKIDHKHRALS